MKYLQWVYKFIKWVVCVIFTAIEVTANWIVEKTDDGSTGASLWQELKELWNGDNNSR